MSKKGQLPPVPVDDYFEARPLLRREFHADLHSAYMDILNEELGPHALTLALAITELEEAFPEIVKLVPIGRTGE